jgi:type VI secretion system secreted protein Hcp
MPIYMKYGNIRGDVTAKGYEGWIEISSAQLGVHRNSTSTPGRGLDREASQPTVTEIAITRLQDGASSDLVRESLRGRATDVEIHFLKTDPKDPNPYLAIKLKSALISNYSIGGSGGDSRGRPMESLTLNFTSIEYSVGGTKNTQKQPPPDSMLQWDLAAQRGG